MKIISIGWLGVRTSNAPAMSAFYRSVLGLELLQQGPDGSSVFRMDDGTEAHVYPENDEFHQFFGTGPVVGFYVDSVAQALEELKVAGVEFIYQKPQHNGKHMWQHFRAPDGNVYEIIGPDEKRAR